jgi:hypothetical protein
MMDVIEGLLSVRKAPAGTIPFRPGTGSHTIELEPLPTADEITGQDPVVVQPDDEYATNPDPDDDRDVLVHAGYYDEVPPGTDMYYPDIRLPNPTQSMTPEKNTLVFDIETTGLKPWECRMVCVTFWNIAETKINMATFFDQNERALVKEIIEYLETMNVEVLVGIT